MGKSIGVVSLKGGVGKTTVVAALGSAMAASVAAGIHKGIIMYSKWRWGYKFEDISEYINEIDIANIQPFTILPLDIFLSSENPVKEILIRIIIGIEYIIEIKFNFTVTPGIFIVVDNKAIDNNIMKNITNFLKFENPIIYLKVGILILYVLIFLIEKYPPNNNK